MKRPHNHRKFYAEEEDQEILRLYESGKSHKYIAKSLGRTSVSISARIKHIKGQPKETTASVNVNDLQEDIKALQEALEHISSSFNILMDLIDSKRFSLNAASQENK
jgi:transposase-like protein